MTWIVAATTEDTTQEPNFWTSVLRVLGEVGNNALQVLIIIVSCIALATVLRFVIRRVVRRIVNGAKSKAKVDDTQALDRSPLSAVRLVQRTRTLGSILQNIVNISLVIVALVLSIQVLNKDILGSLTLITAAIGAGLGFGAQNIVKDVLNGMFIVVEDQVGIGDVVDLGLATGIVEYVSVRVTHVRDVNGTLWYVRNGEITRIGNMSQGWSRLIIDVTVPAESDLEAVEQTVLDTALALSKEPKWRSRIVGRPEMWGLETATKETLVLRVVQRTRSLARDDVGQELRSRLRGALHEAGVSTPGIASVIPVGNDGALRTRGANPPKTKPQPIAETPDTPRPTWRAKRAKSDDQETP